jgi:hypothetical protein
VLKRAGEGVGGPAQWQSLTRLRSWLRHATSADAFRVPAMALASPGGPALVGRLWRARREALLAAALAMASAELLRILVPVGIDTAAQLYQTVRWLHGGFQFWDNYWYDGHYSFVDYSLLYFPIAGLIGQGPTVLATLGASGYLFARLVAGRFGVCSAWPVRAFAVTAAVGVWISGEYPFALGMALGLLALSLQHHRRLPLAALAALAALLASPLAFVLLLVIYAGIALGAGSVRKLLRIDLIAGLGACGVVGALLQLAFPIGGPFHYSVWALLQVLAMSAFAFAASLRLRDVGVIRGIFAAMCIAALCAYFVASPVGGNATRLVDYVGAPLIWILLARQLHERRINRALAAIVGSIVLCGQLAPNLVSATVALDVRSAEPSFWRGAITFLHRHANPDFRVESVDSAGHWDAYYLPAAGIPIVRGWFRQDDFPDNALLYRPALTPTSYEDWLRRSGVRYVVLPHGELDYSAFAEAHLLRSGRSGLRIVYRDRFVTIFELPHATPMLVPPPRRSGAVLRLGHASLLLRTSGPGSYSLAVNYTPYWRVSPPARACVTQAPDGFSVLAVAAAGPLELRFDPTLRGILEGEILEAPSPVCVAGAPAGAARAAPAGNG